MLTHPWHRFRLLQSRAPRNRKPRQPSRRLSIESLEERCLLSADVVIQFNQAVLAAVRNERPSIGFVTRNLAIVQTAIYDAVNAIDHTSSVFHVQASAPADASPVAAAAAAGLFAGAALFPTDAALFQAAYQSALATIPDGPAKTDGIAVGRFVAEQTLISRATDGANAVVSSTPGTAPGDWRPAPPAFAPAQTPQWPNVTPFALRSGSQFRPPPPPALSSQAYAAAFNETKDFGSANSTLKISTDKWFHIDATKLGANPTLPVDPNGGANTAALLKNAVDVKQTDGTHYSGTVDLTGGSASTPLGQPDLDRLGQKAKAVPFTATVDSQGRLTEVKLDFPAVDPQIPAVTSTYSDYGTTVTVTKPDPAQVQEAPDTLYQIFKAK